MSSAELVRDTYILVKYRYNTYRIDVLTKDIGFTQGTELCWAEDERIAAYHPGTKYPDYAKELAAELVGEALKKVRDGLGILDFRDALSTQIQVLISKEQPWNPDNEESW